VQKDRNWDATIALLTGQASLSLWPLLASPLGAAYDNRRLSVCRLLFAVYGGWLPFVPSLSNRLTL